MIEKRLVDPNAYVIDVYNQGMSGENRLGAIQKTALMILAPTTTIMVSQTQTSATTGM